MGDFSAIEKGPFSIIVDKAYLLVRNYQYSQDDEEKEYANCKCKNESLIQRDYSLALQPQTSENLR